MSDLRVAMGQSRPASVMRLRDAKGGVVVCKDLLERVQDFENAVDHVLLGQTAREVEVQV